MDIEAVVLTGGASRRMGEDKAKLLVDGQPLAVRVAGALDDAGIAVTVLGREPVPGHRFLADEDEFGGPLQAIGRFEPRSEFVFVCSCDLPLFDVRLVTLLRDRIGDRDAAVPFVNGFRQPLSALYRASAFTRIPEILGMDGACPMLWLRNLDAIQVSEEEIAAQGLDPQCAQGANTKVELEQMLQSQRPY